MVNTLGLHTTFYQKFLIFPLSLVFVRLWPLREFYDKGFGKGSRSKGLNYLRFQARLNNEIVMEPQTCRKSEAGFCRIICKPRTSWSRVMCGDRVIWNAG